MNVLNLKKSLLMVVMAFLALTLVGCGVGQQVVNVESEIVPNNVQSKADVKKAISKAGASLGWRIREVDANTLKATIRIRNKFPVEVTIPYSKSEYSILYRSSQNLKYNAEENTIHRNYNRWINNLNNRIQNQFYLF
ncbi:hypothetical protein MNBD_GAMMA03-1924 [hydrothermal vent metagenome]|uniref:Lipoprotein n=1 Tax=hydrothermal vent metagenome TaxID=652676 RepID=A0A3B0WAR6_9ZZZZ